MSEAEAAVEAQVGAAEVDTADAEASQGEAAVGLPSCDKGGADAEAEPPPPSPGGEKTRDADGSQGNHANESIDGAEDISFGLLEFLPLRVGPRPKGNISQGAPPKSADPPITLPRLYRMERRDRGHKLGTGCGGIHRAALVSYGGTA